jgi:uncharacterized membrane protein
VTVSSDELVGSERPPLEQIAAGFGEVFTGIRRASADPIIASVFVSMLLIAGGFVAFILAWKGAAATLAVSIQIAFIVSGGLSGFALIGAGLGIMLIQMSRHLDAREDQAWSLVLDRALGLLGVVKARGGLGS